MQIQKLCAHALSIGAVLAATVNALAVGPVAVNSRAALGGTDLVDWGTQNATADVFGNPFSAISQQGLGLTISGATESFNGFERAIQGSSIIPWDGNFTPGDVILWTGTSFTGPQSLIVDFGSPVFGAGAQIQPDLPDGPFNAVIKSYDKDGNLLQTDNFSGTASGAGDGSAIFVGVLSDQENISRIVFSVDDAGAVAINQLDINRTLPENGEYLTILFAVTVFGMAGLRRNVRGFHSA